MQVSRVSNFLNKNLSSKHNSSNISFNGHFRSVEVEAIQNDVFQTRVAGSKTSVTYYLDANEAVYGTIKKAKDFIPGSSIEKLNNIKMDESSKLGVAEVYYSDKNEKINAKNIKKYADYIVYAPGAKNI